MGKELLFEVFRNKIPERTPWVPFAGVHAGKLKGYSAQEILTDGDKLLESLIEVNRVYSPDGQPVMFDLQLEAEILGCDLIWDKKTPPSVVSHPLAKTRKIGLSIPGPDDGRLPIILDVMRNLKKRVGNTTALFGLICGPLTLASHLRGTEFFLDLMKDQAFVANLVEFCREVNKNIATYYIEAGMDVIAIVDPVVSLISPKHFEQFLSEAYTEIFAHIRQNDRFSSFFVCGDATKNIELMCRTKPDSIFVDENIDMVQAKKITDAYQITIGGNLPLTTVMLLGTQMDNMKSAIDLMDEMGRQRYVLAPGCDMPYDVPEENVIGIIQAVRDFEHTKAMLQNYTRENFDIPVDLPDYGNLPRPLVEIFTLDSATCPACGYMKEAVDEAQKHFGKRIDTVEYKLTLAENIARAKKMDIRHVPVILINGDIKYSSYLPSRNDLFKEIEGHI